MISFNTDFLADLAENVICDNKQAPYRMECIEELPDDEVTDFSDGGRLDAQRVRDVFENDLNVPHKLLLKGGGRLLLPALLNHKVRCI